MTRSSWFRIALSATLLLPLAAEGQGLSISSTSLAQVSARIRAVPLDQASTHPLSVTSSPAPQGVDLVVRLEAAKSAALDPAAPRIAAGQSMTAAPLASRIGRDVTLRIRPRVGTPMEIAGATLQTRVETADPSGSALATARRFLQDNRSILRLNDPGRELLLTDFSEDELGFAHLKFEQTWGN